MQHPAYLILYYNIPAFITTIRNPCSKKVFHEIYKLSAPSGDFLAEVYIGG